MKRYTIVFVLILACITAKSQDFNISAKVDERTELLSIVFRLAGAEEYSEGILSQYNKDVDDYFDTYKKSELINYVKLLIKVNGVSYDAVMDMAVHLKIENSEISLNKEIGINNLDKRWKEKKVKTFIDYLSAFYKDSEFHSFFVDHNNLYSTSENRFNTILENINFKWFEEFYGQEPNNNYIVILSMLNGSSNYGSRIIDHQGTEYKYAIMGTSMVDFLNYPMYTKNIIPVIIHEFNHSFCNRLITERSDAFKNSGTKIYPTLKKQMQSQAYGSYETMLFESLVRASVIKYLENQNSSKKQLIRAIADEQRKGFIWTDLLVEKLSEYEADRDQYKTLESFMPEIIKFFDSIAVDFPSYHDKFLLNCPKIVSSSVINNSKVESSLKEISFTFDKPMLNSGYGFSYGKGGKQNFPEIKKVEWKDSKTIKLTVLLEDDKHYSMTFFIRSYISEDGYPMTENYELRFFTE